MPTFDPELPWRGSIYGVIAGHFLQGVAPSAATSSLVGVDAAALALAGPAAALALAHVVSLLFLLLVLLLHEKQLWLSFELLLMLPEMLLHDQLPQFSHVLVLWVLLLLHD